jgi:hypothetical protein
MEEGSEHGKYRVKDAESQLLVGLLVGARGLGLLLVLAFACGGVLVGVESEVFVFICSHLRDAVEEAREVELEHLPRLGIWHMLPLDKV